MAAAVLPTEQTPSPGPDPVYESPLSHHPFLDILSQRVMIFDGAMGTQIHAANLSLTDYWQRENCPEVLGLSRPEVIASIHAAYYAAGADTVETNTFGANKLVLAEFGLQDRCREINRVAAQIARQASTPFATPQRPRFVAGSVGPGTKSITLGYTTFEAMRDSYAEQMRGLLEGGVDAILIETCFDLLQIKVAVIAALDAMREMGRRLPIMAQVTMETNGRMLLGTEISAVIATLEALPVDVLGLNCATGPDAMRPHVAALSTDCTRYLSVQPNAGMPLTEQGRPRYPLTPQALAEAHREFVQAFGVNIVGGCCGTTPEHIRCVAEALRGLAPKPRAAFGRTASAEQAVVSSLYGVVTARQDTSILLIGERTNTNGSRQFREALLAGDVDTLAAIGRDQEKQGAHVIDVCVDYVGRDSAADMRQVVARFAQEIRAPLMIDSTQLDVIEAGLQAAPGKCIVNSINLEEGEEKLAKMCRLLKRYGAAIVAGAIDEDKTEAMAKTADRKLAIARRLHGLLTARYGLAETDIYFDPLIFPIVTGQEEVRRLALETIEGIRRIRAEFPNCHTTLGLSNVSFGLKPYARLVLNSAFFAECVQAGLTSAIVHASKILPRNKIDPQHYQWALDLIYDRTRPDYSPLALLSALGEPCRAGGTVEGLPLEEQLARHIIDGEKKNLQAHLDAALQKYPALQIINDFLLAGMKTVGELFGRGQMQLPFVLQSAEVMKAAVAHLQPHLPKVGGQSRGKLVLATVKGDVHDIGKNLVDIILSNNGYTVYNLGIRQPIADIVAAAQKNSAHAIGLSGLLVKSTLVMRDNLIELNRLGITWPVLLGGAALTRKYVEGELRALYHGPLFYGQDAFEGLKIMDHVAAGKIAELLIATGEPTDRAGLRAGRAGAAAPVPVASAPPPATPGPTGLPTPEDYAPSDIRHDNPIVPLPFYGPRVVRDIPVETVYPYLDEVALFRGQWQFRSGTMGRDEFRRWTQEHIRPIFERIKHRCQELNLLHPRVVYGYFWAQSQRNDLLIYAQDQKTEILRFHFPRQTQRKRWCISDFFRPVECGQMDVVALQCVTIGPELGAYERRLFQEGHYQDYLYIHGLGVQMAEALAEMWHHHIRREWGIDQHDGPNPRDRFACRFQGCRYSFGYPACPNLEDEEKLFRLLDPARIGCTLTENWMIQPEQSTSALVVHHPQARYFNVVPASTREAPASIS